MANYRIAVFASGEGTNFQSLVDAVRNGGLDASVDLLVCDKPSARVVQRAQDAGVDCHLFTPKIMLPVKPMRPRSWKCLNPKKSTWSFLRDI